MQDAETMKRYERLLEEYLFQKTGRVFREPYKALKHPFIDPGAGYKGSLWDWDSFWTAYALRRAIELYGEERFVAETGYSRAQIAEYAKGSALNFLEAQTEDGYVPVMIRGEGTYRDFFVSEHNKGTPVNTIKPFLCQSVLNASVLAKDYGWFDREKLVKYLEYYEKEQRDEGTGLFFWQDDIMIGMDNNPTVFFRPKRSGADMYLNGFMVAEYEAAIELLTALKDERAALVSEKKNALVNAVNTYAWDERDGIYYSQDIGFYRNELKAGGCEFHKNLLPSWKSMPLKIRFWGCFLPLTTGICDEKRAARLVEHLEDENVVARYGVRTVAKNEPMYDLSKSNNPSNWLGAIWTIANYCVWKGLKRYGYQEKAEEIRLKTLEILGWKLEEKGDVFESYHPDTGEETLNAGFLSWNLLALEMIREGEEV